MTERAMERLQALDASKKLFLTAVSPGCGRR